MLHFTKEELTAILLLVGENRDSTKLQKISNMSYLESINLKNKIDDMIEEINKAELEKEKAKQVCPSCHGDGEYEVSAGSHSFFQICTRCGGTGKK